MDFQLKDKTAFITGSTAGIGLAIARSLAAEGARVTVNGRTEDRVQKTVEDLKAEFPGQAFSGIAADFSSDHDVERLLDQLEAPDILINNVGIFTATSFGETTDADWERLFRVNVMSGVRLARRILPEMLTRNEGRIIFISSECAQLVPEDLIAYSVTKTAIHGLARGLAQLTAGTRVTVNTVMPGSTLSEGAERFLSEQAKNTGRAVSEVTEAFFREERRSSLMQRFASVEEIAAAVTYLASPVSGATNGAVLRADGGSVPGVF